MILYRLTKTGQFVPTKPTGKAGAYEQVNLSEVKGRAAMADFLNDLAPVAPMTSEPISEQGRDEDDYQSPFTARTVIAQIDAGMCSTAIRQMDGRNLAIIMSAGIERLSVLSRQINTGPETACSQA